MRQINSFHTLGFNFTSNNFLHYHKSIILELRFLIVRVKYSRKREFPLFIKLILCLNIHIRFQLFKQLFFSSFHFSGMSSRNDTTSPECSAESPTFLSPSSNLLYDQHSSEEELEVIMTKPLDTLIEMSYSNENMDQNQKLKVNNDDEKSPKRCSSSTFLEKRKRSLAHNSDDEVSEYSRW